jgi:putative endonuclease
MRNALRQIEETLHNAARGVVERRAARRARARGEEPLPLHLRAGEHGEDAAFFYLQRQGFTVVARRWRSVRLPGDLDLVAWDGETLVVVEVKTRSRHDLAPANAAVDEHKQKQLRRMAAAYLHQFPEAHRSSIAVRFDVLAVYLLGGPKDRRTEFVHFRNAFPLVAAT